MSGEHGQGDGLADRVDWLVDVFPAGAARLEHALGRIGGASSGARMLRRLRAGASARPEELAVLAEHFDVPHDYFRGDAATVAAIRQRLLGRALRGQDVRSYAICRMPVPMSERLSQIRAALRVLRRTRTRGDETAAEGVAAHGCPTHARAWQDAERSDGRDDGGDAMPVMTEAQLEALCRTAVQDCALSAPFSPRELCQRLGQRRGRRITITATDLGATTGVGHLAPTPRADRILVEHRAPARQQELVIYHELIHLLREHLDTSAAITCGLAGERGAVTGASGDWCEWEAEVGARVLSRLAHERARPNHLPAGREHAPERAIAAAFGFA